MAGSMEVRFLPRPPTSHGAVSCRMASDPQECRQRALICANRAATCTLASTRRKITDLALVWLMLAVEFEEQVPSAQARTAAAIGAPSVFDPLDLEIIIRLRGFRSKRAPRSATGTWIAPAERTS